MKRRLPDESSCSDSNCSLSLDDKDDDDDSGIELSPIKVTPSKAAKRAKVEYTLGCLMIGTYPDKTTEKELVTYKTTDLDVFKRVCENVQEFTDPQIPRGVLPTVLAAFTVTPCHYDMKQYAKWCNIRTDEYSMQLPYIQLAVTLLESCTKREDWQVQRDAVNLYNLNYTVSVNYEMDCSKK